MSSFWVVSSSYYAVDVPYVEIIDTTTYGCALKLDCRDISSSRRSINNEMVKIRVGEAAMAGARYNNWNY